MKEALKRISKNLMPIVSMVIAVATLVISFCMLKVANTSLSAAEQSRLLAEQSLILSSKDFTPVFDFDVDGESGLIRIKNQFPHLYRIEALSVYYIKERGFELTGSDSLVKFSLLTRNAHYEDYHFGTIGQYSDDSSEITVNFYKAIQLATMQKCYDESTIQRIDSYLNTYYDMDSKKGHAWPSLYSACYLLEVYYQDRLGQMRTAYMIQDHIHGRGWWKQTIDEERFMALLQNTQHNEMDYMTDIDSIMDYFITNCKVALK